MLQRDPRGTEQLADGNTFYSLVSGDRILVILWNSESNLKGGNHLMWPTYGALQSLDNVLRKRSQAWGAPSPAASI